MGTPAVGEVKKAAQLLLECAPGAYRPLKVEISRMAQYRDLGLAFTGDYAPLNALVQLEIAQPEKYEQLIVNLDRRRMVLTAEPRAEQRMRKNEYMKEYMRQRRAKLRLERRHQTVTGRDLGEAVDELLQGKPRKRR